MKLWFSVEKHLPGIQKKNQLAFSKQFFHSILLSFMTSSTLLLRSIRNTVGRIIWFVDLKMIKISIYYPYYVLFVNMESILSAIVWKCIDLCISFEPELISKTWQKTLGFEIPSKRPSLFPSLESFLIRIHTGPNQNLIFLRPWISVLH